MCEFHSLFMNVLETDYNKKNTDVFGYVSP